MILAPAPENTIEVSPAARESISPFLSSKFRFWSFISMVLLVFVHGYNGETRYLQPFTAAGEPLNFNSYFQYFLANGIFRFRIPMLFAISGYLFAMNDTLPWKRRAGKRVRTLLVPYLLWSAIALATIWVLELIPFWRNIIISSHMMQIDETRMLLHQNYWYEWLLRWIFFPVAYQLWFIRVLFIYNLAYPAIRWCLKTRLRRTIYFSICSLLFLATFGTPLIEGEGLLFFSLGIWLRKKGADIESRSRALSPAVWGVLFVLAASIKTWLAFKGAPLLHGALNPVLILLHKFTVVSGLIAAWFGMDAVVRNFMSRKWFLWLAGFSFFIYATHAPFVALAIDPALELFKNSANAHLIVFFALPLALVAGGIILGALLRQFAPGTYYTLTGNRGHSIS